MPYRQYCAWHSLSTCAAFTSNPILVGLPCEENSHRMDGNNALNRPFQWKWVIPYTREGVIINNSILILFLTLDNLIIFPVEGSHLPHVFGSIIIGAWKETTETAGTPCHPYFFSTSCMANMADCVPMASLGVWGCLVEILGISEVWLQFLKCQCKE